jgi:CBS domain-containing protein
MVTEGDVAAALGLFRKMAEERHWDARLRRIRVDDVMSRRVITVGPDETLAVCVRLMAEHEISGLPVVEAGRLVGIITKTDLIRAVKTLLK